MVYSIVIRLGLLSILINFWNNCYAQDSIALSEVLKYPDKVFKTLDWKTSSIESKLDWATFKYLSKLQKQEIKLKKKLSKKDTALTHQLFDGIDNKYNSLKNGASQISKFESVYSGHLDSLSTVLSFLKSNNLSSFASNPELQKTLDQYKGLQDQLNASEQIRKYLDQRQQLLKQQFESLGMVKELKQFQKQAYYYKEQIAQYKQAFEDPSQVEQKLLEVVKSVPQFKEFFARNSLLGALFPMPENSSEATASLQGLQTRAMVNQSLADRFGSGPDATQLLQQNLLSAQGQLNDLKNRLNGYSAGSYGNGSSDQQLPNFKPNDQKTKPFLKRLEYGANLQSQKARYMFPRTTDVGLSIGYRINQNSVAGLGLATKIGWGSGWNHIALTYQGLDLRSFLDYKLKGTFFISGGYELNYLNKISSTAQLKDYSAWQKSGLIGLSKKYTISKKLKGDMKLLWDFLSYQQVPQAQPFIFRIGYFFK